MNTPSDAVTQMMNVRNINGLLDEYGYFGLGLDTVTTGDKNGTFGQDKVIKLASRFMIKNRLPFYPVPTPFTSKRCSSCGNVCREFPPKKGKEDKRARNGETNIYKCHIEECELHDPGEHGDLIGAYNNAIFGKFLQDADMPMTNSPDDKYERSLYKELDGHFKLGKKWLLTTLPVV